MKSYATDVRDSIRRLKLDNSGVGGVALTLDDLLVQSPTLHRWASKHSKCAKVRHYVVASSIIYSITFQLSRE